MSAHADAREITKWLSTFTNRPSSTYLVHGEVAPMETLKQRIETTFGWQVSMPQHGQKVDVPL
jgi:metallo-beta-lactamase family protein